MHVRMAKVTVIRAMPPGRIANRVRRDSTVGQTAHV
ncbi:hypothetical protein NP493_1833g00008 [Ridgeia piscesae]|uniref:Uncharacterized protein n=1 Tax=Ridgeia piscesae TaxID=27915 RepID=A0AAD9JTM2_RIDPI|nr:hypothetical protein NP493_1833g00008 [Ridgeia piscesae]